MTEKFSFCSKYKVAIFVGKIVNHQSIKLKHYMRRFNFDPVYKDAVKNYFDPLMHDHCWKKIGFKKYLP
jgi:hypothetical protein